MQQVRSWLLIGVISSLTWIPLMAIDSPEVAMAQQNRSRRTSPLTALANLFRSRSRTGATRGAICVVTPGFGNDQKIWHDRPLIIWESPDVRRVEVRKADSNTVLWQQTINANSHSVRYQGHPLQAGQTYQILFFDAANQNLIKDDQTYPTFTLLEESQRQSIATALSTQAAQLKAQNASDETIALENARFLAEQTLWSDAFQVVYSLPAPSADVRSLIQTTIAEHCQ